MPNEAIKKEAAAEIALKAEHYASAFRIAARTIRLHRPKENTLAHIFDLKAEIEEKFAQELHDDPLGVWAREGF